MKDYVNRNIFAIFSSKRGGDLIFSDPFFRVDTSPDPLLVSLHSPCIFYGVIKLRTTWYVWENLSRGGNAGQIFAYLKKIIFQKS